MNFSRHRFQSIIIFTAVRWNVQFDLSYRDLEQLLQERGVDVDHTSIYRWVQKFSNKVKTEINRYKKYGEKWTVTEEPIQIKKSTQYLYEAVDPQGRTLDFLLSKKKDLKRAERFFEKVVD